MTSVWKITEIIRFSRREFLILNRPGIGVSRFSYPGPSGSSFYKPSSWHVHCIFAQVDAEWHFFHAGTILCISFLCRSALSDISFMLVPLCVSDLKWLPVGWVTRSAWQILLSCEATGPNALLLLTEIVEPLIKYFLLVIFPLSRRGYWNFHSGELDLLRCSQAIQPGILGYPRRFGLLRLRWYLPWFYLDYHLLKTKRNWFVIW